MISYVMQQQLLPTDEELKEHYKGCRGLKIERDNEQVTVSYKQPCIVCGKYHHFRSKASIQCSIIAVSTIVKVVGEQDG